MWSVVGDAIVFPLTGAASMTWPRGRSGRVNQLRDSLPGGEFALHSVMLGLVTWSMRTISPAARPDGTVARVTRRLALPASLARAVGCVNLNQRVPTVMRLEVVPTGILSLV